MVVLREVLDDVDDELEDFVVAPALLALLVEPLDDFPSDLAAAVLDSPLPLLSGVVVVVVVFLAGFSHVTLSRLQSQLLAVCPEGQVP